jgi:DNA-binding response OmpR family regulator
VDEAANGSEALRRFYQGRHRLVVLDIAMPGLDGWSTLTRLREVSDVPVIMLSARTSEAERVQAFRIGADDYVTKPFSADELSLRIEALLRRSSGPSDVDNVHDDGVVRIDFARRSVAVEGREVLLSPIEFRLLAALVHHPDQVLSRQQLLEVAWHDHLGLDSDRVKFCVLRLRRKLGWEVPERSRIQTVRGFGYRYLGAPQPIAAGGNWHVPMAKP